MASATPPPPPLLLLLLLLLQCAPLTPLETANASAEHTFSAQPEIAPLECVEMNPNGLRVKAFLHCTFRTCPGSITWQYKKEPEGEWATIKNETSLERFVTMNVSVARFDTWLTLERNTSYALRLLASASSDAAIIAEGHFTSAPARPPPVQDLQPYSVGVDWVALRWTPPPVAACPWRLLYDIRYREAAGAGLPAGPWWRWFLDPHSPSREAFSTDAAFPCPAQWRGQHCATLAEGLRPDAAYDVEVQVIDSFNISSSEVRMQKVRTEAVAAPPVLAQAPRVVGATDASLTFAADADCAPFCSSYTATWEIRKVPGEAWQRRGRQPVAQNFTFRRLPPMASFEVRALLQRLGDDEPWAGAPQPTPAPDNPWAREPDVPVARTSTCSSAPMPPLNLSVEVRGKTYFLIKWHPPVGACASTRYVVQKELYRRTYGHYDQCPPATAPQPRYNCISGQNVDADDCYARVDGIAPGDKYVIAVIAIDWSGKCSPPTTVYPVALRDHYGLSIGEWSVLTVSLLILVFLAAFAVSEFRRRWPSRWGALSRRPPPPGRRSPPRVAENGHAPFEVALLSEGDAPPADDRRPSEPFV